MGNCEFAVIKNGPFSSVRPAKRIKLCENDGLRKLKVFTTTEFDGSVDPASGMMTFWPAHFRNGSMVSHLCQR